MQNIFFHEVEVAYMQRRVQDAVAADGLAAHAAPRRTTTHWRFRHNLAVACLRVRDLFGRRRPVLQSLPHGQELPAAQG